jgi:phospholipase/lecithinase/hemolysin
MGQGTIADWAAFWEREMQALFSAVGAAHTRGGLTAHLFLNVPPEERAPGYNGNATKTAIEKQRVAEFNSALSRHIAAFQRAHADAIVLQHDTHAFFSRILDAPTAYGFTNTSGYCTCTDDSYFWYSKGYDPTTIGRTLTRYMQTPVIRRRRSIDC